MNKKNGVSIIVLSVTIVVMAILISVAISFLKDSNIMEKAKKTTKDSNIQQIKEVMRVVWNNANADSTPTLAELEAAVTAAILKNEIDTTKYNIIVTEDEIFVSRDFEAPLIASSSMSYTNTTATISLTFSKLKETDYPATVEYYIKKATAPVESYSFKEKVTLVNQLSNIYTYTGLTSATSYNAKIVITDVNGNKTETVLNFKTQ